LNGIRLDRDADQQAMEGRPVEEARAGDLLFFGDARVTHVGMSTGDGMFFHAPQSGAFVERGTQGDRKLRAIRRYLPDPD
jgi:cell wall-associated NlpC family hydrolase